ncbi:hypothetical protein N182_35020 [Sinorhizobium sp. GL2]|nr:hypothetical protein N182_35020 [Sinorhizobium sp. GL2]
MNRTIAACAVLIAAATADASANDGVVYAEVKDTWRITAHPGGNDLADACMASAYYPNINSMLSVLVSIDQQATLAVSSPAVGKNLIDGKSYNFDIYMNGRPYNQTPSVASGNSVAFTLNIDGLNAIMQARSIAIETGILPLGNFNLQHSRAAILKLLECARALQMAQEERAVDRALEEPPSRGLTFEDMPALQSSRSM